MERIPVGRLDVLVPNPQVSDRQYERFFHLDIRNLEDTELADEFHALRPLLWGLPPDDWRRERVRRLEDELNRRSSGTKYTTSGQRKPEVAKGVEL